MVGIFLPLAHFGIIDNAWIERVLSLVGPVVRICVSAVVLSSLLRAFASSQRATVDAAINTSPLLNLQEKEKLLRIA
jgi:hypothetical protein